jgi:hypothetical protein
MSLLGRLTSLVFPGKSTPEGAYHPGPYHISTTSSPGWLPAEWGAWNHWQLDQDPRSGAGVNAMVEACVSAYAQTVSMCPMAHWVRWQWWPRTSDNIGALAHRDCAERLSDAMIS